MFSYRIYGHTISINVSLSLPPIRHRIPDYTILVRDKNLAVKNVTWVHDYELDNDASWFRLGNIGSEYLISLENHARFLINEKSSIIRCYTSPHSQANTLEHLLLDQVLPRVMSRKASLVLHASAIVGEIGMIGFLGKTGYGKSTLTTYYGQHGHSILTDDCLVLHRRQNQFLGFPSYPGVRLNQDMAKILSEGIDQFPKVTEYSTKLRVNPEQGSYVSHEAPEVLQALFVLADPEQGKESETVSIERCSMRDAFSQIIENIFRLDPTDKQDAIKEFKSINKFVSSVPIYSLVYPRRQSFLNNVMQATLELLT